MCQHRPGPLCAYAVARLRTIPAWFQHCPLQSFGSNTSTWSVISVESGSSVESNWCNFVNMGEKIHSAWGRFGAEARRSRRVAGVSQGQLAKSINISPAMMSSLERGTRTPKREHAEALDAALNTGGALTRLWVNLTNQEDVPGWFRDIVLMERQATAIREYQVALVPGILQTADYARTVLKHGRPWDGREEVDRLVEARLNRSELITRTDPPLLWFVVDEVVIHRTIGTPEVMRMQLMHLLKLIDDDVIRLQLVPQHTPTHPGLSGPFRLMSFSDRPPVAHAEHLVGEELIDSPEGVQRCGTIFGALQAEALSPRASADLLRKVTGEPS